MPLTDAWHCAKLVKLQLLPPVLYTAHQDACVSDLPPIRSVTKASALMIA
jgi:hypothetical protein